MSNVGRGREYGKKIIKQYSQKLVIEVGRKYTERNLRYMRQFYETTIETKWNTMCSKLCWSHYREVLSIKDNQIKKERIGQILVYTSYIDNNLKKSK